MSPLATSCGSLSGDRIELPYYCLYVHVKAHVKMAEGRCECADIGFVPAPPTTPPVAGIPAGFVPAPPSSAPGFSGGPPGFGPIFAPPGVAPSAVPRFVGEDREADVAPMPMGGVSGDDEAPMPRGGMYGEDV